MAKKFAFESSKVSIAFSLTAGLGDCVIIKKVLQALIELAPDCVIDIFYVTEAHKIFAESFYRDIKNLNGIWNIDFYKDNIKKYDLALWVAGSHSIILDSVNIARLKKTAPKLLLSLIKIDAYNKKFLYDLNPGGTGPALRNMMLARILHKNCYYFLSCEGALPIRDDKVNIPLFPEYKNQFESLKLGKYITIYSDIHESEKARPKLKTWPLKYLYEYVARMKKRLPKIEIVQCGSGNDIKVENADRRFLSYDLELTKYILANSLLHVGGEGGLIHLATALGTKCLVLFGSSGVDYFGYKQNINLVSEICQPCMYILPDSTTCLRGANEPPCMLAHTPQKVCEVTCNYLENLSERILYD